MGPMLPIAAKRDALSVSCRADRRPSRYLTPSPQRQRHPLGLSFECAMTFGSSFYSSGALASPTLPAPTIASASSAFSSTPRTVPCGDAPIVDSLTDPIPYLQMLTLMPQRRHCLYVSYPSGAPRPQEPQPVSPNPPALMLSLIAAIRITHDRCRAPTTNQIDRDGSKRVEHDRE